MSVMTAMAVKETQRADREEITALMKQVASPDVRMREKERYENFFPKLRAISLRKQERMFYNGTMATGGKRRHASSRAAGWLIFLRGSGTRIPKTYVKGILKK